MHYKVKRNNTGWYYDVLNFRGEEIGCVRGFKTYDAAKLAAECEIYRRTQQRAA